MNIPQSTSTALQILYPGIYPLSQKFCFVPLTRYNSLTAYSCKSISFRDPCRGSLTEGWRSSFASIEASMRGWRNDRNRVPKADSRDQDPESRTWTNDLHHSNWIWSSTESPRSISLPLRVSREGGVQKQCSPELMLWCRGALRPQASGFKSGGSILYIGEWGIYYQLSTQVTSAIDIEAIQGLNELLRYRNREFLCSNKKKLRPFPPLSQSGACHVCLRCQGFQVHWCGSLLSVSELYLHHQVINDFSSFRVFKRKIFRTGR